MVDWGRDNLEKFQIRSPLKLTFISCEVYIFYLNVSTEVRTGVQVKDKH